uniref:C-type lectin domain-containing protein n=1 Tax=Chrysemys picta bellii TaxID=8478 RepID=A0A8C3HXM4_CHRPI
EDKTGCSLRRWDWMDHSIIALVLFIPSGALDIGHCQKTGYWTRWTFGLTQNEHFYVVIFLCSKGWIGYRGKCYYFSETEGNWNNSQSQCSALNASLAAIDSEQEKDFLLCYEGFLDRWIGLQRKPGQPWRWPNGTEFDNRFPIRGGGECAFLMDENWFGSSRCMKWRRWICSKSDVYTMGTGCIVESKL